MVKWSAFFVVAMGAAFGAGLLGAAFGWHGTGQYQQRTGEEIARDNEQNYHFKGEITGRVFLDNGKPAVGFTVRARFVEGHSLSPGEGEAITDANGKYRIHGLYLPNFRPEAFAVQAESGRRPYVPDAPRKIFLNEFPNEKTANVNFTMHLGPQITVRVRDAETGAPVPGVAVEENWNYQTRRLPLGQTDGHGEFRFRAHSLDVDVELSTENLPGKNIVAAPGYEFHNHLRLRGFTDTTLTVKTYNNPFPKTVSAPVPATFRGVVTDSIGTPVGGATVRLWRWGNELRATTDYAGRFSFQTTRIGPFEKRAVRLQATKGNLSATLFPTAEQTWGVIPVRLEASQKTSVTGQVVDAAGKPVSGIPVQYLEIWRGTSDHSSISAKNGGVTDAAGNFRVSGLSTEANYQFRFGGNPQYGNNTAWGRSVFPEIAYSNGWLHLKNGETRNIGQVVVYPADAMIAGHIISKKGGLNITKLFIVVSGKHTYTTVYADAAGNFRANNLVREPLTLGVYGEGGRTSPGSQDDLFQNPVRAGDTNLRVVLR